MTPVCCSKARQDMYAYLNGVTSVKFVIDEPFTDAREDSSLGDNAKVSVGTVAENVEAQNNKRRANLSPFSKAIAAFNSVRVQGSAMLILYLIHPLLIKAPRAKIKKAQPIFT